MTDQEKKVIQEANGLLAGIGFRMVKDGDNEYSIRNRAGKSVAHGDLETVFYCAAFMSGDAESNPAKYAALNQPLNENPMYLAGRAMAKKLMN